MTEKVDSDTVGYDTGPVLPFHRWMTLGSASGSFSDGYVLGVTGISLAVASDTIEISDTWQGLLGSATLVGLFFGALICGRLVDRFGRRPFFGPLMLIFTFVSLVQLLTSPDWSLLVVRFVMGLLLGGDYVSSKALLAEVVPVHWRGRALGALGFAWTLGFAGAYIIGLLMRDLGPDAWKWILATSAIPSLASYLLRLRAPESPRWLVQKGREDAARHIVTTRLGANYDLPESTPKISEPSMKALFRTGVIRNTFIACLVYTVAVMPTFALGTFLPRVYRDTRRSESLRGFARILLLRCNRPFPRVADNRSNFPKNDGFRRFPYLRFDITAAHLRWCQPRLHRGCLRRFRAGHQGHKHGGVCISVGAVLDRVTGARCRTGSSIQPIRCIGHYFFHAHSRGKVRRSHCAGDVCRCLVPRRHHWIHMGTRNFQPIVGTLHEGLRSALPREKDATPFKTTDCGCGCPWLSNSEWSQPLVDA